MTFKVSGNPTASFGQLFVRGLDGKVVGIYTITFTPTLVLTKSYAYFAGRVVGQKEDGAWHGTE